MDRVRRLCINGLLPVLLAGVCGCGGAASPTTTTTTTTTPAAALSTLTLSPTSINGGQTAMVTVTLTEPAPTGGIVVNISTSNTTVMIELKNAVGTIKIPAGATSVTAKITSLPVGSLQLAQIEASYLAVVLESTLTINSKNPLSVASFTANASTLTSGQTANATLTLNAAAYSPGQQVFLSSSDSSVQPQNPVTVPTGSNSVSFSIFTSPISSQRTVMVTASLNSSSVTVQLVLMPTGTAITSLQVIPFTAAGGQSMTGTMTISPPAPDSGLSIALTAAFSNPATPASTPLPITFPATVQVPAGFAQVSFPIMSKAVTATTDVALTATLNTSQSVFTVEIVPALTLAGIDCQLIAVTSGDSDACTVSLSIPAPAGGQTVQLASSFPTGLTVPSSVSIPAGSTSVTLNLVAGNVTAPSIVTLTGNLPATPMVTVTETVTVVSVNNLTLTNFTVTPTILEGGAGFTVLPCSTVPVAACGTVTISSPGPPGGVAVNLASSDPSAQLPNGPTVTVLQNATSATFPITTSSVAVSTTVTITATLNFSNSKLPVTVVPAPVLAGISLAQNSVTGGNSVVGTVTLATVAPQPGVIVALQSSSNLAQVATSVTVPTGSTSVSFSITTLPVTAQQSATITASLGFAIAAPNVPGAQETGNTATITTTTANNFVTGDTVVISGVGQPNYNGTFVVAVLSGTTFSYMNPHIGLTNSGGGIAADLSSARQATLTITAPAPDLRLLFFNPPTITSGRTSTGTVTLTAPAPAGGVLVFLSSSVPATVTVPVSVLVPAGTTSTTFPAKAVSGITASTKVTVNGTVVSLATNILTVIPAQTGTVSEQFVLGGETNSTDFPIHAGNGVSVPQSSLGSGDDTGFLTSIGLSTPTNGTATSTFSFSTYLGGMSSFGQVRDVFVTSAGNVYACGVTMDANLPVTKNAAQSAYGGGKDAFIAEVNATGALQYLSYLGAAGDETCNSLSVDSSGNVYVSGSTTNSSAMGATNLMGTGGAFQTTNSGGNDFFVAKINPTGTSNTSRLVWLTLVGGAGDDFANGRIAVSTLGTVAVSGTSSSTAAAAGPVGFPISSSQARPSLVGVGTFGVVLAISSDGTQLLATTLLYGHVNGSNPGTPTTTTASGGLRFDVDSNLYVCGATNASDLPVSTTAFQPALKGVQNGYVAIVNFDGAISGLTYLGGTSASTVQACKGVTFDSETNILVAMPTDAADYPITSTIPSTLTPGGNSHFAVTKLTSDLSTIVFSTLIGGSGNESADATRLVFDSGENIYFSLATTSGDFPVTSNAVQGMFAGTPGGTNTNVVGIKLSADGSAIFYGTYLGGSANNSTTSVFYLLN